MFLCLADFSYSTYKKKELSKSTTLNIFILDTIIGIVLTTLAVCGYYNSICSLTTSQSFFVLAAVELLPLTYALCLICAGSRKNKVSNNFQTA